MSPFQHQQHSHDRRVTTIGGGLNERFGRLEKPSATAVPKTTMTTTSIQTRQKTSASTSVFSRIKGAPSSSLKKRVGPSSSGIQSRIGRVSTHGGSIQKRVGKAPTTTTTTMASRKRASAKQQLPPAKVKTMMKGNRKTEAKKTKAITEKGQQKKKALSADDLDKALDSYMMKDPKTAQARLNDELDSYMDEAGDVLMDL